ncbi:hypothetical protein G9A89_020761 [Geosiphon pyriformis]|nr:hypothetical protein G9A89_020761 [Geosiphon pyriformis]
MSDKKNFKDSNGFMNGSEKKSDDTLNLSPTIGLNPALETNQSWRHRAAFRKGLFAIIATLLVTRLFFAGFGGYFYKSQHEEKFISNDNTFFTPEFESTSQFKSSWGSPSCDPHTKWEGPKEFLLNPEDISGLIYSVKGASAQGSVIIRRDPNYHGHINITNRIFLSEDSLQEQVKININVSDEDYAMEVKTPSFDGPRPTRKCVRIDTIITLPSHVKYFKSLAVDVPNAWIATESLDDVDFAYVNLKTGNGHIKIEKLNFASAEIGTVNGHVHAEFVVSENLEIKNANGAIDARVRLNPWAENASIVAKSVNGQIDIQVCDITKTQSIDFFARSINGGIVATVDDTFEGDFSASTLVGYASVEGSNLHFEKNSRNGKVGYKGKKEGKTASHAKLEAVTGSIELVFK